MGFSLSHVVKGVVLAMVIYGIRIYMRGGVYNGKERLDGKTTLITGANTGIGKENARDFARRGARVIMACRNLEKCVKAAEEITADTSNHDVICMKLNLASMASIKDFAHDVNQQESRLDILVNNAGVMYTPEMKTEDGFELQLGVNHLGHFLLTHLLLEKLKSSAPSRIVTVSSSVHRVTQGMDFDDLMMTKEYSRFHSYFRSKLANVLFSKELAERLKGTGVTTYSLHPGVVETELGRYILDFPGSSILHGLLQPIVWILLKNPMEGAQTQIYCAVAPELANKSGKYYSDCKEKIPTSYAQDEDQAKKLWEVSEEILGLKS